MVQWDEIGVKVEEVKEEMEVEVEVMVVKLGVVVVLVVEVMVLTVEAGMKEVLGIVTVLLGSLRLLSRRGLEGMAGGKTIEGLVGGTGGKGTARGIGVVEIGEDSFLGKLSFK